MTAVMMQSATGEIDNASGNNVPQLLVSVQDWPEAIAAIDANVDLLDFKSPSRGPLAPVSPALWQRAACQIGTSTHGGPSNVPRLSAALGETDQARDVAASVPPEFAYAKVGPSGCGSRAELIRLWDQIRNDLSPHTQLVAVAYADHQAAKCLPWDQVLMAALYAGMTRFLVDTFDKTSASSIQLMGWHGMARLHQRSRQTGIRWMAAGRLKMTDVTGFASRGCLPDGFGVRGDVCGGNRVRPIDRQRVDRWRRQVALCRNKNP
ncbi:(5-formylfuran-3-yl)methyl phosphate synthase [Crateriforma spongiae]|uniref:(5-formylfuran-3-yl)methyl phosphate synthase n=1 Tax=Crateriforma spongiae TaxID=2724528 RepID=UPI001447C8A5|nr:(5-formylfuran-3-yl)methyl phosphate synthase [Crateriforma spongiae]